uniref:(California timema) hypothetical protein n=1 Tax=Timema californicum TaxID=61474 RepID=A0A7R9JDM8_TIMCA|nr:unnamed protein product [Timema californicum]
MDKANKTGSLVSSVRLHVRSPELDEEIELFLLQLLHRKVKFTAYDFFPLDFTLVYSFVGAVTTYLVILIQFQLMERSGDVEFNSTSINTTSTHQH